MDIGQALGCFGYICEAWSGEEARGNDCQYDSTW